MGPDELRQANYNLRSSPKGLKFLCVVPLSESSKVMGLVEIHDLDALHHFNGLTHYPWCGKDEPEWNEGTVVNHLWMVHYRLGLVATNAMTAHQPHWTLSTATAGRTVSSQGRKSLMNWFHQSSYQR